MSYSPTHCPQAFWKPLISLALFALLLPAPAHALKDGYYKKSVRIAGRTMSCRKTKILVSRKYWMVGGSIPGTIGLNPQKLKRYSKVEQWFIFTHECGHQRVGRSESKADCWAAKAGRRQGWLTQKGLKRICRTLRKDPAGDGYPSGKKRCRIMQRCYKAAKR